MAETPDNINSANGQLSVWDWPVRLCHWATVMLLPALWYTGEEGIFDWHFPLAYTLLGVWSFRILWFFIGSPYAKWQSLTLAPAKVKAYLTGQETTYYGHNPLGSYSVLLMLGLIGLQLASGLVSSDDFMYDGPLVGILPGSLESLLNRIHHLNVNLLIGVIGLHLSAVAYYQWVKRQPLIQSMLHGRKPK